MFKVDNGNDCLKVREGIVVTSISLDGYNFPIPNGFSEFLLRAGYWEYGEKTSESNDVLSNYDREVFIEDGQLCTKLTFKSVSKKEAC